MRCRTALRAVLALIGFTAILAQIVLMRELMVVFYGNEISLGIILANWLLWTALGSGVLGRLAGRARNPQKHLAVLQCAVAFAFPLTIFAVRASKAFAHTIPGEVLGPGPMLLTSLAVLSVFCSASGMLFVAGAAVFARECKTSAVTASSSVYLWEAAGSGAGGLLASLLLVRYLGSFDIASVVCLLNLLAASLILQSVRVRRAMIALLLAAFAFLVFPNLDKWFERSSQARLWQGLNVVESQNSVYGNLAVVKTEGALSLYQNGLVLFTVPDPATAEEVVHFALLQHPAPRSLLLIGGGLNGSLAQALRHSTLERVDYVELDPTIFDLAHDHFPAEWSLIRSHARVQIHAADGRLFLKTSAQTYDVVILDLPDPETAQLNRFYTLDFFREVAAHLNPGGVFSFQLRGAEDYISPELGDFLRCVRKTLGEVFPQVTFIPGSTFHFFAAKQAGILATGPRDLQARLNSRGLHTLYVREYYIPYRMMPDRMHEADIETQPRAATPVNRDFTPIAYYFDVALWSGRFDQNLRRVFIWLAGIRFAWIISAAGLVMLGLAGTLGGLARKEDRSRRAAGFCVGTTGFTLMALEILLLLGFQAVFGYVYFQLAILIAAFMAGIAAGSWAALRQSPEKATQQNPRRDLVTLTLLQTVVTFSPLLLFVLLAGFAQLRNSLGLWLAGQISFPLLALLSGMLGGCQFPIASRVFFSGSTHGAQHSGTLYALDLAGACLGAVAISVYLVPVFGFFKTALIIAAANLAAVAMAFLAAWRHRPHPA
ncbi:MAG: fused MFS/spermidine synthase [Deltaproteobacteria bacterium]